MNHRTGPEQEITIVVVDDDRMSMLLGSMVSSMGYRPVTLPSGEAVVEYVQRNCPPALILLDVSLPGMNGIETLRRLKQLSPTQSIAMTSSLSDIDTVVSAIRLGALDYLVKPFSVTALERTICSCMRKATSSVTRFAAAPVPFITGCEPMERIRENVERVADTDVPVLILGESGVGKEIVARHLHNCSRRASHNLVKVNCAALPSELLESELFGFEKGAFTGASASNPGKFQVASGGTLFLDEIGEIHPSLQAKLLHVLQDGRYFRLGSSTPTHVDVRIIAATNVNIPEALKTGKLRQDLYYRLNVFSMSIPPVRERRECIPVFVDYFLSRFSEVPTRVSAALMNLMMRYNWPGNVRELENFIRRYLIIANEEAMIAELEQAIADHAAPSLAAAAVEGAIFETAPAPAIPVGRPNGATKALRELKREAERKAICSALEANKWRRTQAAKALHISYKALLYKIRDLDIC